MKKQNKRKETLFMEGKMVWFIVILFSMTICFIFEKWLNIRYLAIQRNVQNGDLVDWKKYLTLGCAIAVASAVMYAGNVFIDLWTERIQKVRFFQQFNGVIQEDGKLQPSLKVFTIASAKIGCILITIKTIIGVAYTAVITKMVDLNATHYIGGIAIFCVAIALGCYRGKLQAKTDMLGAETQGLQQKLSSCFMISDKVLDERLKEIKSNYKDRAKLQCIKMFTQKTPEVAKTAILIMLFYNATAIADVEIRTIYSTYCLVASAYLGIVGVAESISEMIENITKINRFKQEPEVREIEKQRANRIREVSVSRDSVKITDSGVVITTSFTASFKKGKGMKAHYKLTNELNVSPQKIPLVIGKNGIGKSVFCKMLRSSMPNAICYDVQTGLVEQFCHNFRYSDCEIDFDLVQRLAAGLDIDSIPESLKEFKEYKFFSPNAAGRQMMILLQILYIANMECRNGIKPMIILDEVFANLATDKMQKVLPFIFHEIKACGAMAIIVSHGYQEELKEYVDVIWRLELDDEKNEVTIVEEPV